MQSNTTCPLVEQYLIYLVVIKGRAQKTIKEYRTDLLQFFSYVSDSRNTPVVNKNFAIINLQFVKSISLKDMYSFIAYHQTVQQSSAGTRARKIVSIRQFWKYLKTKAHLINDNIAEELETPKLPKRIPKYSYLGGISKVANRMQEIAEGPLHHNNFSELCITVIGTG